MSVKTGPHREKVCLRGPALEYYLIKPSISITRILPCKKADQDKLYYCAEAQTKSSLDKSQDLELTFFTLLFKFKCSQENSLHAG